jgi:tetratricopeptide (TPR) repeat protein
MMRVLLFFFALCPLLFSCHAIPRMGVGGQYQEGKAQFLRGRGGNMDMAIVALESVVSQNPTYKDSLTLLGRAYYAKGRYQDAYQILQRALAVNPKDEVAWLVLGLTELRLGDDQRGLETLKSGITAVARLNTNSFTAEYPSWDYRGGIRAAIRRTVFLAQKGLEEKDELIRSAETVLLRMDEEERYQRIVTGQQRRDDF